MYLICSTEPVVTILNTVGTHEKLLPLFCQLNNGFTIEKCVLKIQTEFCAVKTLIRASSINSLI